MCPCIIHDSSCDGGPAISFTSFQNCLSNHKEKKSLLNALLTFQPVDVSSFFILSTFPNLCWHILKQQKQKKRHKVEFWWIFLFFLKHYFPKTRQSFFLSITKRNYMCIELVNIQKILFFIST